MTREGEDTTYTREKKWLPACLRARPWLHNCFSERELGARRGDGRCCCAYVGGGKQWSGTAWWLLRARRGKADPPTSAASSPGSRCSILPGGALRRRGLQHAVEMRVRRLAPHPRTATNSMASAPLPASASPTAMTAVLRHQIAVAVRCAPPAPPISPPPAPGSSRWGWS
jgi:hypothetical protein